MNDDHHFRVTELFKDGTVAATNSAGEEKFFGLCVEGGSSPTLYLCSRKWDDKPFPPADWRERNSLGTEGL
jgi:hypothetical protein